MNRFKKAVIYKYYRMLLNLKKGWNPLCVCVCVSDCMIGTVDCFAKQNMPDKDKYNVWQYFMWNLKNKNHMNRKRDCWMVALSGLEIDKIEKWW